MMEERISKQELMRCYNVDRSTIESWINNRGLPMIRISSHRKYVKKSEWLAWEKKMMINKTEEDGIEQYREHQ